MPGQLLLPATGGARLSAHGCSLSPAISLLLSPTQVKALQDVVTKQLAQQQQPPPHMQMPMHPMMMPFPWYPPVHPYMPQHQPPPPQQPPQQQQQQPQPPPGQQPQEKSPARKGKHNDAEPDGGLWLCVWGGASAARV